MPLSNTIRANRAYSDARITEVVQTSFSAYDIKEQSTEVLEFGPSFRPLNSPNVAFLYTSIRNEGFRKSDAILVWETASIPMPVIAGNHLLQAANTQQLPKVPCIFILGCKHPAPTDSDLLFAHQRAILYERMSSPRSSLSRLIEIRSILQERQAQGRQPAAFSVKDLRTGLPPRGQGGPHFKHWAQDISDDHLRLYLKCAKVFRVAGISNVIDDIERLCYNPARIPADFLFQVSKVELLQRGLGLTIMKRLFSDIKQNPQSTIALTSAEKDEIEELTTGQPSPIPKRTKKPRGIVKKKRAPPSQTGLSKLKVGLDLMKDGLSEVDRKALGMPEKRVLVEINKKLNRLEELTKDFSDKVNRN